MIAQQGVALTFYAFFTESKVGKTGLTVTIDVYESTTGTPIISGGSATELAGGLYYYTLASGSVDADGAYIGIFKTATTTVDQQHLPAVWSVGNVVSADVVSMDTGVVTADALAADAITDAKVASDVTIASVTGAVGSVTGNVAGSVASVTAGVTVTTNNDKTDYALSGAGIQAIWDALTSALTTVGSVGKLLVDNINAAISSRSSHSAADVWSAVTRTLTANTNLNDLDAAGVRTAVGLASANLDTQLSALPTAEENRAEIDSNSTQLAAIVGDTSELQTDLANGGRLDLLIDAILADTNELQTDLANGGRLDLLIDAILADTGSLNDTVLAEITGASDIPATPTMRQALMLLYMWLRNDTQATSSERRILNDAGTEVLDATTSDNSTVYSQGKLGAV